MKIDTKNIKTCFLDQFWGICIFTHKLQDKNEWNLFMCRGKGKNIITFAQMYLNIIWSNEPQILRFLIDIWGANILVNQLLLMSQKLAGRP